MYNECDEYTDLGHCIECGSHMYRLNGELHIEPYPGNTHLCHSDQDLDLYNNHKSKVEGEII